MRIIELKLDLLRCRRADAVVVTATSPGIDPILLQGLAIMNVISCQSFNDAPWRASRDAFLPPSGIAARSGPSEAIEPRMVELASDQLLNYWLRIDSQNSMSVPLELRT